MGTVVHKPHKVAHSGLGISAFGIALFAGAGLLVAFNSLGLEPKANFQNRDLLGLVMIGCGFLETVAIALAGTALTYARRKTAFPIAALLLASAPLALVIALLFGIAD